MSPAPIERSETVTETALEEADVAVAARLAAHRHHPAMRAAGALSEIADQPPLFALCGAVLAYGFLAGDRRAALGGGRMLAAFLAATWMKGGLKRLVSRTRPNVLLDEGRYDVRVRGPDEGPWHSFPSGHTAGGLAVARAFARTWPEARWPAYAAAGAIALIQIPRGAHYPLDVMAGAALGLAAEALVDHAFTAAGPLLPDGHAERGTPRRRT
jgi:membrane-associated phospholipid phosphatase